MGRTVPICLSLLLCDQAEWDAGAAKTTLRGVFHSLTAAAFPAAFPRCSVWIELTNGHGETSMTLRLAHITPQDVDGRIVFDVGFTVTFSDPRAIHRHHLSAVELELPEPGEYRLGLHASGLPLFERRLEVRRRREQRP